MWESAFNTPDQEVLRRAPVYDAVIATQFAKLWASLVVPTLEDISAGAAIPWADPSLIIQIRQVFWTLGQSLLGNDLYQDLPVALCVYAALPLNGDAESRFFPEAQLPALKVAQNLSSRYQWMKGETGTSMVSQCATVM